mgnify:CR=1 FL=1
MSARNYLDHPPIRCLANWTFNLGLSDFALYTVTIIKIIMFFIIAVVYYCYLIHHCYRNTITIISTRVVITVVIVISHPATNDW